MEPVIKAQGSGYEVEWPSLHVRIQVRHIRARMEGGFKAQVAIWFEDRPIHRSNPVLDSVSGMDQLTRRLKRRVPPEDYDIDWEQVVEDLAGIVIDEYRRGTDEVVLGDIRQPEASTWRIDNLLIAGEPTLIWADGGTGKSMFALFLAVLVSEGHMDTDYQLVVEPGRVLYLDWETSAEELSSRVKKIHAGLGITNPSGIIYRYMGQPLISEVDRVRDIVHSRDIDMIVYDSMGLAVAGELESAENVLGFFRAVRMIGGTALIVSHANKGGTLFGSAYTSNASRSVFEAQRTLGTKGASIVLSLFHRKANNVSTAPPQSWQMDFSAEDRIVFHRLETFDTDAQGSLSYMQLVYEILKREGPKDKAYLDETIAVMKNTPVDKVKPRVSTAVSKHRASGKILDHGELLMVAAKPTENGENQTWDIPV